MLIAIAVVIALILGIGSGYFLRKIFGEAKISSAEEAAKKIVSDAQRESGAKKKEALLEVKDEIHQLRSEAEREVKERRAEIQRSEKRLQQKEESVDAKLGIVEQKENSIIETERKLAKEKEEFQKVFEEEKRLLEQVAKLSVKEARDILLQKVKDEIRHESAKLIRDIENQAKEEAERRARNIVSLAIQRTAADHVAETTVSVVPLPGDDMKGRIIGREGRNIRAFENLTGIDLIIDDTPEAVILSSFDPIRREIGRVTLEKLIADGRIHPARIEEMYNKAKAEVEAEIKAQGEQATFDTDIHGLNPELVYTLGRLHYRTSYGQNVLKHSIEVSHLASIMAAELGANGVIAKRAGLLHDIGKAIDQELDGPHATLGSDLASRLKEQTSITHAIEAHHGDKEPQTVEAVLVQAADAISASRPGARRETLESYIKRLESLENIAESHKGVEKCYAIQAGRELRVMVKPEDVDDVTSHSLAREIASEIEEQLQYPGQIKVTVIRESRATEYAK